MPKLKIFSFIVILNIFIILYCSSKDNSKQVFSSSNNCIENVLKAKYMEDIFQADTISLFIPDSFLISMITDLDFNKDGKIIVCDNRTRRVLLFDNRGNFIQQIGRDGSGPGEYVSPKYLATNRKDEIIVADVSQFRISTFDKDGNFLHSFSVKHNIHGLLISPKNEIIIYDPSLSRITREKPTVYVYNEKGDLVRKFGVTSDAYQKLKAIPFDGVGPYLAVSEKYLFEVDYPDYHIRKYEIEGTFIKEFGVKPKVWHSLLETNYQKLSPQKHVSPSNMRILNDYFEKEFAKCTFLYCLKYFKPGILCTMTMNGYHDFSKGFSFSFYDIDGNLLKNGLTFRNFPKLTSIPFKYFFPGAPNQLCLVEFMNDNKASNQRINLIVIKLICLNNS